jgi:hypothetical protein
MNPYALLGTASLSEPIGTVSLKLSEGFSRLLPSVVVFGIALIIAGVYCLTVVSGMSTHWARTAAVSLRADESPGLRLVSSPGSGAFSATIVELERHRSDDRTTTCDRTCKRFQILL